MIFNPIIKKTVSVNSTALPKDVNFYDYDGTLLYSYTLSEAQMLTALPKGPVHDGLIFQSWNWTLEKVQALTRPMNVGAMYITDDGKTRLKIRVWDKARSNVPLYISQTVANGVSIDWGDGSATETLSGNGNVNTSHQYAVGDYTIALSVTDGCVLGLGDGSSARCVLGNAWSSGLVYCNLLQKVNIGYGVVSIGNSAFRECRSLANVTIPDSVTSIGNAAFYNCCSLTSVAFSKSINSIDQHAFHACVHLKTIMLPDSIPTIKNNILYGCGSLPSIHIPSSVTSIGNGAFYGCASLASLTIPDGVIDIANGAFSACWGIAEYHLKPAIPPALADVNAFEGIPSNCIIYVPTGSLEAYKTAANWSTYADRMREEP